MLYYITRPFAKIALGIYFRKIYLNGVERIPADKPVILAVNHPTAFIDPCLLACCQPRSLYFLARGDLYVKYAWARWLYRLYRIIPLFRLEDAGYSNLKTNFDSFGRVHEILRKNKAVMILAEGRTLHEKRLRALRKGTARLVFGTLKKYPDLDLHVVPVGMNYTNSDHFRSEVMVEIGEPFRAKDYLPVYESNPAKAVNIFTADLRQRLLNCVIHFEEKEDEIWGNFLLEMLQNERPADIFPVYKKDEHPFLSEKQLVDKINAMTEEAKLQKHSEVKTYRDQLSKYGITDQGLADHLTYGLKNALFLGIGRFPALSGYLLNALPVVPAVHLANRLAPSIEFRSSMALTFGAMAWLFYWLIFTASALWAGSTFLRILSLLMPLSGYFYVIYREKEKRWNECKAANLLEDEEIEQLGALRSTLRSSYPLEAG